MRIEQLEYLAAVVEHGSLRRAGEQLHLSAPALSEALSNLERELGVTLLERRRAGTQISARGAALLGEVHAVLDAVERLRAAAEERALTSVLRLGTVNTATSCLVSPALQAFQSAQPGTWVEVLDLQQAQIEQRLADSTLDLGLINLLADDDVPAGLTATPLLRGRPVVVLPASHPLAAQDSISTDDLRRHHFIAMRSGYLMRRFTQSLFGATPPVTTSSADGAAMGKLMVAEGLGLCVLPDYSVTDDPLHRSGVITHRRLQDDETAVLLVMVHHPGSRDLPAVAGLRSALLDQASTCATVALT